MTPVDNKNGRLCIHYHEADDPAAQADEHTLAVISFGDASFIDNSDDRRIQVGLPLLSGTRPVEVWRSDQNHESGTHGRIGYRHTGDLLFGQLCLEDAQFDGLEALTRQVYRQILALQKETGYPHLLRIWNYFPWINRDENGLERYRAFCVGRHQAIDTTRGYEHELPAATAIGTHGDNTLVYFLASREPGTQIENPRQVSAFEYPDLYSPKSPAFSRAVHKRWSGDTHLYISGTASIIGHETRHRHDYIRQLAECLNNIDALIAETRKTTPTRLDSAADLSGIKIYLRHPDYLEHARDYVEDRLGKDTPVVYLLGDVCRRDLLLEVEGLFSSC